ncbi:MAG: carboxypeptidase-like regulatory domain-containing protein [Myxococcota bacterium]|nr:carboxypeptidase-like regulatory domain-containing protein [Myxococcota bacterium]
MPEVPQRAQLQGSLDTGGKLPADGNDVVLISEDGARTVQRTSGGGAFGFVDLAPGLYFLEVSLPGFSSFVRPNLRLRGGDSLQLGALVPSWLGGTSQEGIITGRVVAVDSSQTTGGQVEFLLQPSGTRVALAAIGLGGDFVQRVPPGSYKLRASHPLFVTTESPPVSVTESQSLDLSSQPLSMDINPATLSGSVLRERDGDTAVPASGALVTLGNGTTTTTDASGGFLITGLAGGERTVRVTLAGFHDPLPTRIATLVPGEGTSLDPVTVRLDRGALAGTVQLSDGQTANDITVALNGLPYSAGVAPDPSVPSRGSFLLSGVPVGSYELVATKARYSRATLPNVTVGTDATTQVGALTLTILQGDFDIIDPDGANTPGYSRSRAVALNLSNFGSAAEYRASEDPSFASTAYVPFTGGSQKAFTLADTQGTRTVYAQYKDAGGTESPVFSASVVLDTVAPTAPALTVAGGDGFTRVSNPLVVTLAATELLPPGVDTVSGLARVRLSTASTVDGNGVLVATPVTYQRDLAFTRPGSTDGPVTVYAQFEDHAGNVGAVISDQVVVDTAPPTGSIALADGPRATAPGFTHQALVDLEMSAAAEPNGGYTLIKIANSQGALNSAVFQPVQSVAAWFLDPTSNGQKTVYAQLQDAAGNVGLTQLSAQITYDTIAPSPISATLQGPSITNAAQVTLLLSAADNTQLSPTAAVTVSEDAYFQGPGTVGPGAYPADNLVTYPLSVEDGAKQIYLRLRDAAGNDSTASVRVTRDSTPPAASFTLEGILADGTPSSTLSSTASVTARITHSGASLFLLGDASLVSCPSTAGSYTVLSTPAVTHTLGGTGPTRTVTLCVRDAAGNTGGPYTQTILLDAAVPSFCTLELQGFRRDGSAAPAGLTAAADVTATVSGCNEVPSELYLTTGAVTCSASASLGWQPFTQGGTISLPVGDGAKTVRGCVRDAARNVGNVQPAAVTLDTAAPSPATAAIVGSSTTNNATLTLNLSASDPSGLHPSSAVTVSEDAYFADATTVGPAAFPGGGQLAYPLSAGDGAKRLYVRFRDALGNEAITSLTATLDTTAPQAVLAVTGTLADGTPSSTVTSVTAVTVNLLQLAGADEYVIGNDTLTTCPSSGYSALASVTLFHTLSGTAAPRQVRVCLRDLAGNVTGPLVAAISLDTVAPGGCALAVAGYTTRGDPAPGGLTGTYRVTATIGSCVEAPVDVVLSPSPVTCAPGSALAWQQFTNTLDFFLPGPDGANTVYGCVRDAARNTTGITSAQITLDTTPPSNPQVLLDDGASYVNAAQVSSRGGYVASAAGTATGAVEWGVSESPGDGSWRSYTLFNPLDFTFAGTGVRRLYAVFRDEVGNTSAVASDTITFDILAPSVTLAQLQVAPGGNGYINTTSALVQLRNTPNDAWQMQVAPAANPGGCVASDFATATAEAFTTNPFLVLLAPGDGTKRVCARLLDAAGNVSAMFSGTVILDTTPPTSPVIITSPAVVNATQANPFTVTTAGAVTETNFARYEQVGGGAQSWTLASSGIATTSFNFTLQANASYETGYPNSLQLRAVDLAGNVSATSSVVIIKDTNLPNAVGTQVLWITNGDQKGSVYWTPSSSPDVVGHRIYYGSASGSYEGSYADQGPSPLYTQADGVVSLSGLINGAPTYVEVRPVDHAGNEGSGSTEVLLQPNLVSPNKIATLSVPNMDYFGRLAIQGDRLFALAFQGTNCVYGSPTHRPTLLTIDLSKLVSPVASGAPDPSPLTPTVTGQLVMPDMVDCYQVPIPNYTALQVDGRWAYLAAGTRLYIVDVLNPDAPTLKATLNYAPTVLRALQVKGNVLFAAGATGAGGVFAVNLAKLYDNDPLSFPTTADSLGSHNGNAGPDGLFWTRGHLTELYGANTFHYNVADALDGNVFTVWNSTDPRVLGSLGGTTALPSPLGFGNYLFAVEQNRVGTYDLGPVFSGGALSFASPLATVPIGGRGQFDVAGAQLFYQDDQSKGVRSVDFTDLNAPVDQGFLQTEQYSTGFANLTYGPYLIHGDTGQLVFAEIATPRSLRRVATGASGMPRNHVVPGALVGGGTVMDLLAPWPPAPIASDVDTCFYDDVLFGEVSVQAQGTRLRVTNLEDSSDRDAATPFDAADSYTLDLSPDVATGLAEAANRLVVVERRSDGTYLEVFDAMAVIDRMPTTLLTRPGLGSYKVTSNTANRMQVSMHRGRALVTLDNENNTNPTVMGLYVVDLRPLLDDDPATAMTPITTTPNSVQGFVQALPTGNFSWYPGHRQSVGRGNWAYVASGHGVEIIDISAALDDSLSTTLPGVPVRSSVNVLGGFKALSVYGSYALFVPQHQGVNAAVISLDVSDPLNPRKVSSVPLVKDTTSCIPSGLGSITPHSGISMSGTRAYLTMRNLTWVMEVE